MELSAMIFAAGLGTRMADRSYPKPLTKIGNKRQIDIILDNVIKFGIKDIVINTHYLAEQMHDYLLENYPSIKISHEEHLLETGGGLLKASKSFNSQYFLTINCDVLWHDPNLLPALYKLWLKKKSDITMVFKNCNFSATRFMVCDDNTVIMEENMPHYYTGIQIINVELLRKYDDSRFSLSKVYIDCKEDNGKMRGVSGLVYEDDDVFHIGTEKELNFIRGAYGNKEY